MNNLQVDKNSQLITGIRIYKIDYWYPVHVLEQRTVFNKKDFSLKIRFNKK